MYEVGQYVLVHKSRWPQRKVEKIASPWFGPFKVVQVHFNSLEIMASPTMGGLVKVSYSQVKHWSSVHDPFSFPAGLGSSCAEEDEESEGAIGFSPLAGPVTTSGVGLGIRDARDEHRGAGDAQEHGEQEGTKGGEQEAREDGPQTRARSKRAASSARDTPPGRTETGGNQREEPPVFPKVSAPPSVLEVPYRRRFEFKKVQGPGGPVQHGAAYHQGDVQVQGAGAEDLQAGVPPVQGDQEVQEDVGVSVPVQSSSVVHFSPEDAARLGFYHVEAILAHKYKSGWKFLVKWESFPVHCASWEPVKSFILPRGKVNSVFLKYVEENGLTDVLKKLRDSTGQQE